MARSSTGNDNTAQDPETGIVYDVTDPSNPVPIDEAPEAANEPSSRAGTQTEPTRGSEAPQTYEPGSTMYEMGFRDVSEYLAAQQAGVHYGIHEGSLVPEDTIILTDKDGNPRYRATLKEIEDAQETSAGIAEYVARGQALYPYEGEYIPYDRYLAKVQEAEEKHQAEQRAFAEQNVISVDESGTISGVPKEQWEGLAPKYRIIGDEQGFEAMQKAIKADHITLPDNTMIAISDWNEIPEKYQHIAMTEGYDKMQEAIKIDHIELPDGTLIPIKDWNQLPEEYQVMALHEGRAGLDTAIEGARKGEMEYSFALASLRDKGYVTDVDGKTSINIAKALRDNPDNEEQLKSVGVNEGELEKAREFNQQYLGVGSPEYVPETQFIKNYFAERGWKYKTHLGYADEAEIKLYNSHLREAAEAHDKKYSPPMSQDQFVYNYFQDKGWEYEPARGVMTPKEIEKWKPAYDKQLTEASRAFEDKYGLKAVAKSGGGKMVDTLVPGLYIAKNYGTMGATEIIINGLIDAAFTAFIIGASINPLRAGLRKAFLIGKTPFEKQMMALDKAIASGEVRATRAEAIKLRNIGEAMKATGLEGAGSVIENATFISQRPEFVILNRKVFKGRTPKALKQSVQSMYGGMGEPFIRNIQTGRGQVQAVVPISRSEAFGLTNADIDSIWNKVGNNREAFLREAKKIKTDRFNEAMKLINEATVERTGQTPTAKPVKFKVFPTAMTPEEAAAVQEMITIDIFKKVIQKERKKALREALKKMSRGNRNFTREEASALVAKARENEKMYKMLAQRALDRLDDMGANRMLAKMLSQDTVIPATALEPKMMAEALEKANTKTRIEVKSALNTEIYKALENKNYNKARALAARLQETVFKTINDIATDVQNEVATKPDIKLQVQPLTDTELKQLEQTKTKTATELATETLTDTTTKTITQPKVTTGVATGVTAVTPTEGIEPTKPIRPPKKVPPKIKIDLESELNEQYRRRKIPGYVIFKQGWQKYGVLPPFTQKNLINLGRTQPDSPQNSLVIVGKVPRSISFDLGVTDGYIDTKSKTIVYNGNGENTDVGTEMSSPTKGVSIPAQEDIMEEVNTYPDDVELVEVPEGDGVSDLVDVSKEDIMGDDTEDLSDLTDVSSDDIIGTPKKRYKVVRRRQPQKIEQYPVMRGMG